MAFQVATLSTTAWAGIASGSPITITKPTGLAVGDLMVAHIGANDEDANTASVASNDSFTSLGNATLSDSNGMAATLVFWKFATSGDVAASTFTFQNNSGEGMGMAGTIYRITGAGAVQAMAGATVAGGTTPSFANTITPSIANSLLLFLYTGTDSGGVATTAASYAITTDNPTWTEHAESSGDLFAFFGAGNGITPLLAGASAPRSQITATGNSTLTTSQDFNYHTGVIVVISPVVSVTVIAPDPAIVTVTANAVTASGGATVTAPNPGAVTITANAVTPSTPAEIWSNQSKSSSSWTNQDKS